MLNYGIHRVVYSDMIHTVVSDAEDPGSPPCFRLQGIELLQGEKDIKLWAASKRPRRYCGQGRARYFRHESICKCPNRILSIPRALE